MDIISDYTTRIVEAMAAGTFTAETASRIAEEVRHDWAGERAYIARTGEAASLELTRRNIAIIRDYRNGERSGLLARRYGISRSMVLKVIKGR